MYTTINTLEEYNELLQKKQALLVYFSTEECQVCKVLKPKIDQLLSSRFPELRLFHVNLNVSPEIAAQNRIFAVPSIQLVFGGKEYLRRSRSFSLNELAENISRPYHLMFT